MKIYHEKLEDWIDNVEVGDTTFVYSVGEDIKITSIVKVDFEEKVIWFTGILTKDLRVNSIEIK